MTSNWIVVANRAGARIFARPSEDAELGLVTRMAHPEGRMTNRELESDKQGSARFGSSGGGYERHEDSHEHSARKFAAEIAKHLDHARTSHSFDQLVLVAEPHFLGMLKHELSRETAARVRETVHKDLHAVPDRDIASHVPRHPASA